MVDTGPTTSTAGSTPTAAVMDRPRERTVINAGGVVADDGTLRSGHAAGPPPYDHLLAHSPDDGRTDG